MNHPRLKNPRLCRILTYIVVIGTGLLPTIVFFNLPVPDGLKVIVLLGSLIGHLIYLIRNFPVLMMMDMVLAMESCYRTARSKYHLPQHRSADAIRSSILRYGVKGGFLSIAKSRTTKIETCLLPKHKRFREFTDSWNLFHLMITSSR